MAVREYSHGKASDRSNNMTEQSSDGKTLSRHSGTIESLKACSWADLLETMQEIERSQDGNGVYWAPEDHDCSLGRVLAIALAVRSR